MSGGVRQSFFQSLAPRYVLPLFRELPARWLHVLLFEAQMA